MCKIQQGGFADKVQLHNLKWNEGFSADKEQAPPPPHKKKKKKERRFPHT